MKKSLLFLFLLSVSQLSEAQEKFRDVESLLKSVAGRSVYSFAISANNKRIVIQQLQDGTPGWWRLYESVFEDSAWSPFAEIKIINEWKRKAVIGCAKLSYDGNEIFFFSNNDIYFSERKANAWSIPRDVGKKINTSGFESFPSLSADGKTLYFVKQNHEGPRNAEVIKKNTFCCSIYQSTRDASGSWSSPTRLPWPINQDCEKAPRILADGKTLLFASNRPGGAGEHDLYCSRIDEDGEWSYPEPLKFLNTPLDDLQSEVTADGNQVYYYDHETQSVKVTALPEAFRPAPMHVIEGVVENEKNGEPLSATITLDLGDTEVSSVKSNRFTGAFTMVVPQGAVYGLQITADGFADHAATVDGFETHEEIRVKMKRAEGRKTETQKAPVAEADADATIKPSGKQYALLIGVSEYKDPALNLTNPVKDAETLRRILVTRYRFEDADVTVMSNPTRQEMLGELYNFRKRITKDDNLLIFYAGHGVWDDEVKQGYWWPSDAGKDNPANWLSNSDLREQIRAIPSAHTLLISDACFSGGIFKTRGDDIRAAPLAIQMLYKTRSRRAITSGNLSSVPDESVFFRYLSQKLNDNTEKYLPSQALFNSVRMAVINNTLAVPQEGVINDAGDEGGDFIFILR